MDRYEVHSEIASGGMASVHLGRSRGEVGFSRTVAIKRLYPQFAKDPAFVAMLMDEARLAARIHHPNVVAVLDVFSEDGDLSLVMEYIVGESLAALLLAARLHGGRMPPAIVVSLISGALAGLHAAHEAKSETDEPLEIVHRDVSPQNVLVGIDGVARLLDFGIAKARVRAQATRDGMLKGKLRYLAPEQLEDGDATRRSDVYATGVVLWEALTGEKPFDADSEGAVVSRILEGSLAVPSRAMEGIPAALDAVVFRATSRDPSTRFETAQEMQAALERALQPATPREVGAWVSTVAKDTLAGRAEIVRAIERGRISLAPETRANADATETFVRPAPGATTSTSLTTEAMPDAPRAPKNRVIFGAAIAIALAFVTAAAWKLRRNPVSIAASSIQQPHVEVTIVSSVPKVDEPRLSASATSPVKRQAPIVAPPATSSVTSRNKPAASVLPLQTPKRPSCDPPYVEDANGIRRVKRECL